MDNMDYNVLDEAKHALHDLEQNAWKNHKGQYIETLGKIEEFNDRIELQEDRLNNVQTMDEYNDIQDQLTNIINDILRVNDEFNASLMVVDEVKAPIEPEDVFTIDNIEQ